MTDVAEQIPISDDLLMLMRNAARLASTLREPFISVRTLLVALLEDANIGPALAQSLSRERLEAYQFPEDAGTRLTASRIPEPNLEPGERAAILRFNTLAFKMPDGSKSVWLSREAHSAWIEGAKRVEEGSQYLPKHLAFGIAADAIRSPGVLAALNVEPGTVSEAMLKLE